MRQSASPTKTPAIPEPSSIWITADCKRGIPSEQVELWRIFPIPMQTTPGDITWVADPELPDRREAFVQSMSRAESWRVFGAVPDPTCPLVIIAKGAA